MMSRHIINLIHCVTKSYKSRGFQYALLLQQRSIASFFEGNTMSKTSTHGVYYSSRFYTNIRISKRYGTLNHSLINFSNHFEMPTEVQRRNMNTSLQHVSSEKMSSKGPFNGMPLTLGFVLKSKVYTIAFEGDKQKTDIVNANSSPQYVDYYAGPERDLINFPRPVRKEYPDKVRHAFIPESWFQSFYDKTGVTGFYTFLFAMMTFLISKEIYVLEHEFYNGISVAIICQYCVKNFGPKLAAFLDRMVDDCAQNWEMQRKMEENAYEDGIENEQISQYQAEGQMKLFEIKKQIVAIQLECEYRKRLWEAYNEVVQQLEKELLKQQICKYIAHKNMQQWVLNHVLRGITPDVELAVLKWSIALMQDLACHHHSSFFPSAMGEQQECSVVFASMNETSGLGMSLQGIHAISEIEEKYSLDESKIFPLLLKFPDSEHK